MAGFYEICRPPVEDRKMNQIFDSKECQEQDPIRSTYSMRPKFSTMCHYYYFSVENDLLRIFLTLLCNDVADSADAQNRRSPSSRSQGRKLTCLVLCKTKPKQRITSPYFFHPFFSSDPRSPSEARASQTEISLLIPRQTWPLSHSFGTPLSPPDVSLYCAGLISLADELSNTPYAPIGGAEPLVSRSGRA